MKGPGGMADLSALEFILSKSHDFITLIDRDYRYVFANPAYCAAVERSRMDVLGVTVAELWGESVFESSIRSRLDRCFEGQEVHYSQRFPVGSVERDMRVSMYPYAHDEGPPSHVVVYGYDATRVSQIEAKLSDYEYRDVVTGLFNRRSLEVILEMELQKARKSGPELDRGALMHIHLLNHETAVESYGDHIGDLILENTGLRVKETLRPTDYVFRHEGPALMAILPRIRRKADVALVARKLHDEITLPYHYGTVDFVPTCGIGVTIFPDDGDENHSLVRNAVSAFAEADRRGDAFCIYDPALHRLAIDRLKMTTELRRAFGREEFRLHFQPIVDEQRRVVGAETLLRWRRGDGSLVSAGSFIELAEETDSIEAIDRWVLFNLCRELAAWDRDAPAYVTVNLSAKTFVSDNLGHLVSSALRAAPDLDPRRVKIEITERDCMADPAHAVANIAMLADMGIDVWIDDFGTGQSSLAYLRTLPATVLKIDKQFVDDVVSGPEDIVFLANIINSVRARHKDVLVEGIESLQQHDLLVRIGCDRLQGYYYAKPMPAGELAALMRRGQALGEPLEEEAPVRSADIS